MKASGNTLNVHSTFLTIQGEGPYAGRGAMFIRLAGCNLQCPWCDTEYTSKQLVSVHQLIEEVEESTAKLIVVTGGEPFRQNLVPLISRAFMSDLHVQIETNGKLPPARSTADQFWKLHKRGDVTIVVSPKTSLISCEMRNRANAYKYVMSHDEVWEDGLPTRVLGHPLPKGIRHVARPEGNYQGPIYLQPADQGNVDINRLNREACIRSVIENARYTLCLQQHKILGLP